MVQLCPTKDPTTPSTVVTEDPLIFEYEANAREELATAYTLLMNMYYHFVCPPIQAPAEAASALREFVTTQDRQFNEIVVVHLLSSIVSHAEDNGIVTLMTSVALLM